MNHYPRHIGDWMRDTAHLSEIEECMYSRCLDQYYSREKALPLDLVQCARLVRAASAAARKALAGVLREFFDESPDGWHQKRCDEELAAFKERSASAKQSAAASVKSRQANAQRNVERTLSERSTSHKPVASNQEPEAKATEVELPTPLKSLSPSAPSVSGLGTRLPDDWKLPEPWREWATSAHPELDSQRVVRISLSFRDHWLAKPGKDGRKADWLATWRNWIRREIERV